MNRLEADGEYKGLEASSKFVNEIHHLRYN